MSGTGTNPSLPIDNLAFGKIIEVDGGSHYCRVGLQDYGTVSHSRRRCIPDRPVWFHRQSPFREKNYIRICWPVEDEIRIRARDGYQHTDRR